MVVSDSKTPRDGGFIERIGHYDPRTDPPTVVIQQEKAREWIGHGAQPTDAVAYLLHKAGVIPEAPRRVMKPKAVEEAPRKEEAPVSEAPKAEAPAAEAAKPEAARAEAKKEAAPKAEVQAEAKAEKPEAHKPKAKKSEEPKP